MSFENGELKKVTPEETQGMELDSQWPIDTQIDLMLQKKKWKLKKMKKKMKKSRHVSKKDKKKYKHLQKDYRKLQMQKDSTVFQHKIELLELQHKYEIQSMRDKMELLMYKMLVRSAGINTQQEGNYCEMFALPDYIGGNKHV